uniref:TBC1 domain family member 10A n=1 Tax=Cacopsylla melanoneura TaxID=428564 RepID=A0A8D8YKW6_9HEMI
MTGVKARDPSSVPGLETMRARKYLPYRTSMGFWAVNNTRHIQSKYHQQYKAYPDNKKLDPRSISQLLNREKKWMEMIRQWDLNMQKNYKKVRSRCRKGIPRKIRPLAWHYLCGGQLLMGKPDTGCYAEFLSRLVQGYTIQGVTLSSCPGKGIPSIWQTFRKILTDSSSMRCS